MVSTLTEIKSEARKLIAMKIQKINENEENDFFSFFYYYKILIETLSAAIIKVLLDRNGVKINLQTFKENFKIASSSISKGIKLVNEFIKLVYYKKKI